MSEAGDWSDDDDEETVLVPAPPSSSALSEVDEDVINGDVINQVMNVFAQASTAHTFGQKRYMSRPGDNPRWNDTLNVAVGPSRRIFTIEYGFVTKISDYFLQGWPDVDGNPSPVPINLTEVDEEIFEVFNNFLQNRGRITMDDSVLDPAANAPNPDVLLVKCWMFGRACSARALQNAIVDFYAKYLRPKLVCLTDHESVPPRPTPASTWPPPPSPPPPQPLDPRTATLPMPRMLKCGPAWDLCPEGTQLHLLLADLWTMHEYIDYRNMWPEEGDNVGPQMTSDMCQADEDKKGRIERGGWANPLFGGKATRCRRYHVHVEGDKTGAECGDT